MHGCYVPEIKVGESVIVARGSAGLVTVRVQHGPPALAVVVQGAKDGWWPTSPALVPDASA